MPFSRRAANEEAPLGVGPRHLDPVHLVGLIAEMEVDIGKRTAILVDDRPHDRAAGVEEEVGDSKGIAASRIERTEAQGQVLLGPRVQPQRSLLQEPMERVAAVVAGAQRSHGAIVSERRVVADQRHGNSAEREAIGADDLAGDRRARRRGRAWNSGRLWNFGPICYRLVRMLLFLASLRRPSVRLARAKRSEGAKERSREGFPRALPTRESGRSASGRGVQDRRSAALAPPAGSSARAPAGRPAFAPRRRFCPSPRPCGVRLWRLTARSRAGVRRGGAPRRTR
jgi:hypothetical protein